MHQHGAAAGSLFSHHRWCRDIDGLRQRRFLLGFVHGGVGGGIDDHGGPLGLQQAAKCGCVAQVDVLAGERGDGPQNMQARGEFMAKLSGSAEQQNAVKRHTACQPIGGIGHW